MKQSIIALSLVGAVLGRPGVNRYNFEKREVPQEHAHRNVNLEVSKSLNLDNPDNIQDPIFGLLGAAAAAAGAGSIADPDCLQQATADQAFTNAKAAGDVNGMTFALIFRALERNTGSVGLASVPCTSIQAVNPEIAALQQHQDPASDGAAALNKQIAQDLAAQIGAIGGDPTLANEASTFAPGEIGDATAKGNTCDDDADDAGCINTLGLRVDDLTEEEALAAAQGGAGAGNAAAGNGTAAADSENANKDSGNADDSDAGAAACLAAGNADSGNATDNAGDAGNADSGNASNDAGNASADAGNAANATADAGAAAGAAAFGSCSDPTITFSQAPSDGRQEAAFEATDLTNFPHGSALGIGVISSFICDQLVNKCKAEQAAVDSCDQADAAVKASGLSGQAAADSFNQALGF
ncbi:uncharacterized protein N0V89_011158 [Didymosphaeria variabile]|uniref:Uncharacterized protein n=1 Tax=Didymosphaeria variabile TaxID=1932322 RepID=A0A9W8XE85_9PLEO|nr:uncharacterized protein N0V89_011158 [Didymosphaeria variabile]KAJ4347219.1 hypothetical protein N0V89_011158 [Didymosphaeria variabile]